MYSPVVLKKSLSIAAIYVLQAVAPALVVLASLAVIAYEQDAELTRPLAGFAIMAAALGLLLLQPERNGMVGSVLSPLSTGMRLVIRWLALLGVLLAFGYVTGISSEFPRRVVLPWALIAPALVFVTWLALNALMRRIVLSRDNLRTAVIAGVNEPSLALASKLAEHPEFATRLEGFFDDRGAERLGPMGEHAQLGGLADMAQYVRTHRVDVIFIALPIRHIQRVMALLDELRDTTASLYFIPDVFVFDLIQSRTAEIMGIPVVAMCETPFYGNRAVTKRLTDLALTVCLLLVTLPVMVVIAAAIKLTSRGPMIFRQRRYGLDGEEIVVYKFRSMYLTEDGPKITQATRDDPRITPIGRIIRRYSLDELPQLFNVLEGKMSLVGPRPHAVAHNEQYRRVIKGYMIRHKVLPGITGLAQVNGYRGETRELEDMQARVNYDLEYLRRWSPVLDIKILFLTALRVFKDSKAY
jgi:putative colanic acid biosynthesis UDP-glucose lipid carrier transferase